MSITWEATAWHARYTSGPDLECGAGPNAWVAAQVLGTRPGRVLDLDAGEGQRDLAGPAWLVGHRA